MEPVALQNMNRWTALLMHSLHYGALGFMVVAYTVKIMQLLKKPAASEGTPARGEHDRAIRYAYLTLAMPWEIEGQRTHLWRYVEFVVFHLAMAAGIGWAFVTPILGAHMATPIVAYVFTAFFGAGALVGLSRLLRRILVVEMRRISSPDDYFCLLLLTAWMGTGVAAARLTDAALLTAYYVLATFFLVYVPFSKISHYVYWPFIRYYMGKHFGHRGVYPKKGTITQHG